MNLCDVIPDEDFRFSMRFSKGAVAGFYGATQDHESLVSQRIQCLEKTPDRYAGMHDEGVPLLEEAEIVAREAGGLRDTVLEGLARPNRPLAKCRMLGAAWEPDFLLMKFTDDQLPRLLGGCVCFPSHWSLAEKIGMPMDTIHAPVPGLNTGLSSQINGFLSRMKPGISWERSNWGLAATPELNLHPERQLPRLHGAVEARNAWLRIEWQSLVALPESNGILFGIRLEIVPLQTVMDDPEATRRLSRALATMPPEMARYKGLAECRGRLIELLQS